MVVHSFVRASIAVLCFNKPAVVIVVYPHLLLDFPSTPRVALALQPATAAMRDTASTIDNMGILLASIAV